jgi:hypothetical protein
VTLNPNPFPSRPLSPKFPPHPSLTCSAGKRPSAGECSS